MSDDAAAGCVGAGMRFRYAALAGELLSAIEKGIYRPGDRLPGVRRLAMTHSVSVSTAIAAVRRLEDDGVVQARPRSGFYVRSNVNRWLDVPAVSRPDIRPTAVTGQDLVLRLVQATNDPGIVQLGAAVPDPAFLPTRAIERAMARAARQHRLRAATYEFPPGAPELRLQIARRLAQRGCDDSPDEIVITSGAQEALTLALKAVTAPGDVVAVESPTFYGLLQVIESLGLKALEIPTDPGTGIELAALRLAIERWPVAACVSVPSFSNPLGSCMPDDRRRALVELLARHGIPLVEDDVYGELGFDGPSPRSLRAWAGQGEVIHCGSFSKTLSPGLRLGWIAAGKRLFEQVEYLKYVESLAAPTLPQLAVADYLAHGGYDRYLSGVRQEYARAVARMREAVARFFPRGTRVSRPGGGFVLWLELPDHIDTLKLANRALAAGISIAPGPAFSANGKYQNCLRLSCATPWGERLERSLRVLASLIDTP